MRGPSENQQIGNNVHRCQQAIRWLLIALLGSIAAVSNASEKLFKWVDEQGQVHYGDQLSTQANQGEHSILNKQGVRVKRINAVQTPEQRAEAEAQAKLERQQHAKEAEKARYDQILLQTFTTERDLLMARDDRIGTIDSTIRVNNNRLQSLERQLDDLNVHLRRLDVTDHQTSNRLLQQRGVLEQQRDKLQQANLSKQQERQQLLDRFEADLNRFRELKAVQESSK